MSARCPNGKRLIAASGHQHLFAEHVTQKHFAIGQLLRFKTFFEIRSFKLARMFSHKFPLLCNITIAPLRRRERFYQALRKSETIIIPRKDGTRRDEGSARRAAVVWPKE